jgi:hypothetical protein
VGCTDPEHAGGRARSYYMPMDRRPRDLSLTTERGSAGGEIRSADVFRRDGAHGMQRADGTVRLFLLLAIVQVHNTVQH